MIMMANSQWSHDHDGQLAVESLALIRNRQTAVKYKSNSIRILVKRQSKMGQNERAKQWSNGGQILVGPRSNTCQTAVKYKSNSIRILVKQQSKLGQNERSNTCRTVVKYLSNGSQIQVEQHSNTCPFPVEKAACKISYINSGITVYLSNVTVT